MLYFWSTPKGSTNSFLLTGSWVCYLLHQFINLGKAQSPACRSSSRQCVKPSVSCSTIREFYGGPCCFKSFWNYKFAFKSEFCKSGHDSCYFSHRTASNFYSIRLWIHLIWYLVACLFWSVNELIHMTYLFLLPFPPHVLANWACLERKNRNTLSKIFLILYLLHPPSNIFIYLLRKKAYTLLYFSNANFQQAFLTTTLVPLWGKKMREWC